MKKLLIVTLFYLSANLPVIGQGSGLIKGYIKDAATLKPVYNVNIVVEGLPAGTTTDENGFYFIKSGSFPVTLSMSHVAYKKKTVVVTQSNSNLVVYLERSVDSLPEVSVTARKITNLVERKFYDVVDYEPVGDSVILLAYSWRDTVNPWIILLSHDGDTLLRKNVVNEGKLYKDCMGNIHLITKNTAYQLFIEKNELYLLYPMNSDSFIKILDPCVTSLKGRFYLKQGNTHNQVLSYSVYNSTDSTYKRFRIISDDIALRMLADRNRFYAMGAAAPTDADIRFEEMCFFDPVYAPLLRLKDELYIFNFVHSVIEKYLPDGNPAGSVPVTFHKNKGWKEKVMSDEISGKAYTLFMKNGISSLSEINLQTGELCSEIKIPDFKFVENIKVHNGYAFFLYRNNASLELTRVYRMKL